MQPNQIGQQMNHFFIQGTPQNNGGTVLATNNLFQQIRLPQGGNMGWNVGGGQVMPQMQQTSLSLSQLSQGQQRQQPVIINTQGQGTQMQQPIIINTNQMNMNQRYITQNQIGQQLKINTMPTQMQQQQQQPSIIQTQQIQNRLSSIQVPQSVIQRPQQSVSDNQTVDRNVNLPSIISTTSHKVESKCENKADNAMEDDSAMDSTHTINSKKLTQMVQSIDSHLLLDDELKNVFTQYMEEFLIHVTDNACKLAKLRNSNTLETKDFQYIMERDWGVYVPGYQSVTEKPKQASENEIHRNRLNLIKKANR